MTLYIIQEFDSDTMKWVNHDSYDSKDLAEVSIQIKRRTPWYSDLRIVESYNRSYWADGPMGVTPPTGCWNEIKKDLGIKEAN